jgi:N-acetylglucosamine-6-phosphate deacetylase
MTIALPSHFSLSGPTLYGERGSILTEATITVREGKIETVGSKQVSTGKNISLPHTYHVVPGFIDVHIHGCNGADVMEGSEQALQALANQLPRFGVTAFLATTMTDAVPRIESALKSVQAYRAEEGAELLGVHLEGPFLSKKALGAQPIECVRAPDVSLFERWQALSGNRIKLTTLAPEEDRDFSLIRHLVSHGVIASIGHTHATYEETKRAIEMGCTHATHLFNAMRCFHHRDPGCVGAILRSQSVIIELIADGLHLHPATLALVVQAVGLDRCVLISDGLSLAGLPAGKYSVSNQTILVDETSAQLPNGTLAGSLLMLDQAVRNMQTYLNLPLHEVIRCVTETPAKHLKLFDRIGSLTVGKDADIVVLDEQYRVVMTICKGQLSYAK